MRNENKPKQEVIYQQSYPRIENYIHKHEHNHKDYYKVGEFSLWKVIILVTIIDIIVNVIMRLV